VPSHLADPAAFDFAALHSQQGDEDVRQWFDTADASDLA